MSTKLALITVVYQNYDILEDLFTSLKQQTNKAFHLYISDLSESKKNIASDSVPLTVIAGENRGYAHGVNIGMQQAMKDGYTTLAVINSDVVVDKNFIANTLRSLQNHSSSIVGGKIYYAPGFEYHKSRYKPKDVGKVLWYAGGKIDWDNIYVQHLGVDEVDENQYDDERETNFITGCFMAFNKATFDAIGQWDEKYFLYYEDADFCERAKRAGTTLYYDPEIILWHKNAQSTGGSGSNLHSLYQTKNRIRFGLKYGPFKTKLFLIRDSILNK